MAMLSEFFDPRAAGAAGLIPEYNPVSPPEWPLPWQADEAQAARDVAANRLRRQGKRGGYDPMALEGRVPDALHMERLNENSGAPPAAIAPAQAAPAPAVPGMLNAPAAPVLAPGSMPPPPEAASPNFDLTRPGATPLPAVPSAGGSFPPAQGFGDTGVPVQGFGGDLPARPAASSAPAGPAWAGMLNAPLPASIAGGGYPSPASPASTAAPAASATSPDKPASVPSTSLLARIGDMINNRSGTLLALGAGLSGAQNIGQGLSRGFAAAIPAMQSDIKLQQQNQTVAALVARGIPKDAALAAASNPAIMSQMVANVFGAKQKQFTQIGEDMLGNKRYGFVDPVAGKVYGLDGKDITGEGGSGGAMVPNGPDGWPLSGQPLLEHLEKNDPVTAAGVKALIGGELNAGGRNLQKLAPVASLVDPTFDMGTFKARQALRQSYLGGGKNFQEALALNTVSGHMGHLADAAERLDNSSWKPINKVKNWWSDTFTGSPDLVRFRDALTTTQNELAKAYHGGHVSDAAYNAFNKSVNEAQTPAELRATIGELSSLLQSKIEANEEGYKSGMATGTQLPQEYRAVGDRAKEAFQRIREWSHGIAPAAGAAPPAGAPAAPAPPHAAPAPGHWVDLGGGIRIREMP